jgi:putative spermidine/putrescine transport system ATP-binding protein
MGYRNVLTLNAGARNGQRIALEGQGLKLEGAVKQDPGAKAAVAIRPEDISVGGGPNAIAGKVENVEYGGHESLVDVRAGNDVLLHVRTGARVKMGEAVTLTVAPERLLVYPAETA